MAIVLNDPYARGVGGDIGSRIGNSLSTGLQGLAQSKLQMLQQQLQQAQQARGFSGLPGVTPEYAQALSMVNPLAQQQVLKGLQQQNLQQQNLSQIMNQLQQGGYSPEESALLQLLSSNPKALLEGMSALRGGQPEGMQNQPVQASLPMAQQQNQASMTPAQRIGQSSGVYNQKQQAQINAATKKWNDGVSLAVRNAEDTIEDAQEALKILNEGGTAAGLYGNLPDFLQSGKSRLLESKYNAIAGRLAGQYGIPTNAKIRFAQSQKPQLNMPLETQRAHLLNIIKQAQKPLLMAQLRDQLISQNNYQIPAGLETKVNQAYKDYLQQEGSSNEMMGMQKAVSQGGLTPNRDNEDLLGTLLRGGVRSAARMGSATLGLPGDITGAVTGLTNYLTGTQIPNPLPGSRDIDEAINKATGGYTKPSEGFEQVLDDIVSTAGSLFGPAKVPGVAAKLFAGAGAPKIAAKAATIKLPFTGEIPLAKALKLAAYGEAGAKTVEALGGGPIPQAVAKLTFMTAASAPGARSKLQALTEQEYALARQQFAGEKESVKNLIGRITQLENKFTREALPEADVWKPIIESVRNGLHQSPDGKMNINELIKQEQNLNSLFSRTQPEYFKGQAGSRLPKDIIEPLREIKEEIGKVIGRSAKKNPEALQHYLKAKDLYRGLQEESKLTRWLTNNAKFTGLFSSSLPSFLFKKGMGGILEWAAKYPKAWDAFRNPRLKADFALAMKSANEGNAKAFIQHLSKVDKEIKKQNIES